MNTKQVEELTGITRQNIRYYERQNLLEPVRDTENAYRDYSQEDVRRLKLIKMLRMLDMPIKEIEQVLNGKLPIKEAAARQQEALVQQQRQLQAAIEICGSIRKEKSEDISVDDYLERMEHMRKGGGIFAQIVDDYKRAVQEERSRQFFFYSAQAVNTAGMLEKAIQEYAEKQRKSFRLVKGGMYPEFRLDGVLYTAACTLEKDMETKDVRTRIICSRAEEEKEEKAVRNRKRLFREFYSVGVNIRRHRFKSVLNAAISMMTVLVLLFYFGSLTSTRQQFEELPEAIPVRAVVMNAIGELKNSLLIRQQVLDTVYHSPYIWKIKETAELVGQSGPDSGEFQVLGVNCRDAVCEDGQEEVSWVENWDWKHFLKGENVCVAEKSFLEKQNKKAGDTILLSLEHYRLAGIGHTLERAPLGTKELKVVGIAEEQGAALPAVVVPIDAVKQMYQENDRVYFASSLAFTVKEPMKLNALKEQLKEAGLNSVVPELTESNVGSALLIEDDVFIQAAIELEKNILLLETFLPFMLLIVLLAGYLVPHLLLQGRRSEYAIMRALGMGRKHCTLLFFAEHILLAIAGGCIGAVAGSVFSTAKPLTAAAVLVLYLCCHALGSGAAMWMFGKMSVAAVLSHRD